MTSLLCCRQLLSCHLTRVSTCPFGYTKLSYATKSIRQMRNEDGIYLLPYSFRLMHRIAVFIRQRYLSILRRQISACRIT